MDKKKDPILNSNRILWASVSFCLETGVRVDTSTLSSISKDNLLTQALANIKRTLDNVCDFSYFELILQSKVSFEELQTKFRGEDNSVRLLNKKLAKEKKTVRSFIS